jgi:hypothetical protein
MITDVLQEIKHRAEYVAEVRAHVCEVLGQFQQDAEAKGAKMSLVLDTPGPSGASIELSEKTSRSNSSIYAEINTTGDIVIMRQNNLGGPPEAAESERRPLDLTKDPISTAADVLLILADDHLGYVGSSLESFLGRSTGASLTETFDPGPEP